MATDDGREALKLIEEMRSRGIRGNERIFHEALDAIGKAGLLNEAFALFHSLQQMKLLQPTPYTFSILLKSCAVAKDLGRALDLVERVMPSLGMPAKSAAVWNGLLGVCSSVGNMDKGFEVWQSMLGANITPDVHTERILATMFASNPQLAAELVSEVRTLQRGRKDEKSGAGRTIYSEDQGNMGKAIRSLSSESNQKPIWLDSIASSVYTVSDLMSFVAPEGRRGRLGSTTSSSSRGGGRGVQRRDGNDDAIHEETTMMSDAVGRGSGDRLGQSGTATATSMHSTSAMSSSEKKKSSPFENIDTSENMNLLYLDLHGHSQAAAVMSLLRRLEVLVGMWPEMKSTIGANQALSNLPHKTKEESENKRNAEEDVKEGTGAGGLVIVTGVGRGSPDGQGVLKNFVTEILKRQGLRATELPQNKGRLLVPWSELSQFLEERRSKMQREVLMAAARARYMYIGAVVSSRL